MIRKSRHFRKIALRASCAVVFCLFALVSAHAQFLGYTSPQTVTLAAALNAVSAPTTVTVPNSGQSIHYLTYTTSLTTCKPRLRLEGSSDGTNFFSISQDATDPTSGGIFAAGYFPVVRINLVSFSGCAGTITANYTGTSTSLGPPAGTFNQAAGYRTTLALASSIGTGATLTVNAYGPYAQSSGTIYFQFNAAGAGGTTTLQVLVGPDFNHLAATPVLNVTVANNANLQSFNVPQALGNAEQVLIACSGAPCATNPTQDAFYQFIATGVAQGIFSDQVQGTAANGSPVVGNPVWVGLWDGTNVVAPPSCDLSAPISITFGGSGTTQILAAPGSGKYRICHISFASSAVANFQIVSGTGSNCGTGTGNMTGSYQNISGLALDLWPSTLIAPAVSEVCVTASAAATIGGVIVYAPAY